MKTVDTVYGNSQAVNIEMEYTLNRKRTAADSITER